MVAADDLWRANCAAQDLLLPNVSKSLLSPGCLTEGEMLQTSDATEPCTNVPASTNRTDNAVRHRKSLCEDRLITLAELQKHQAYPSIWITVSNRVYDVTKWAKHHPGGEAAICSVGGRDATDLMSQFHRPEVWQKRIENWFVGNLDLSGDELKCVPERSRKVASEFRQLDTWLHENGWYKPSYTFITRKMAVLVGLFSLGLYLFVDGLAVEAGQSAKWTLYLSGLVIGLFWQQANFVGHDVGHSSVFESGLSHNILGLLVGNVFTGLSINWWKHSHYTHHVTTNVVQHDPDIQHLPVFAVTDKIFSYVPGKGAGIFSKYWNAFMPFDRLSKLLVSYQHFLYLPIMSIARVNLLAQSVLFILTHPRCRGGLKLAELCSLVLFYSWYGYMLYLCPSWASRILFWYAANAMVGIIHVQICLSHFIMQTFDEMPYQKNSEESFYEFQLRTTMDIDCPRYMDWFHGGLQYQVIHHLYPRIPRHRLRDLREKVERILAQYSHISYKHYPFIRANVLTIQHMKKVAMQAKAGKLIPFQNTMIFEAWNAQG